jgi:hypothetical protein
MISRTDFLEMFIQTEKKMKRALKIFGIQKQKTQILGRQEFKETKIKGIENLFINRTENFSNPGKT